MGLWEGINTSTQGLYGWVNAYLVFNSELSVADFFFNEKEDNNNKGLGAYVIHYIFYFEKEKKRQAFQTILF